MEKNIEEHYDFKSDFSLKGKRVSLLFEKGVFSCFGARIAKKRNGGNTFHATAQCCQLGSPWCPEANHKGFVLPSTVWRRGEPYPEGFNSKYDFKETDVLNMLK